MLRGLLGTEPWFEPKSFGYGAGLPCAWQGWVLLLGYIGVAIGLALSVVWLGLPLFILALTAITMPFLWLAKRHTRGGWRWRG